jgi:hypothetical protein
VGTAIPTKTIPTQFTVSNNADNSSNNDNNLNKVVFMFRYTVNYTSCSDYCCRHFCRDCYNRRCCPTRDLKRNSISQVQKFSIKNLLNHESLKKVSKKFLIISNDFFFIKFNFENFYLSMPLFSSVFQISC